MTGRRRTRRIQRLRGPLGLIAVASALLCGCGSQAPLIADGTPGPAPAVTTASSPADCDLVASTDGSDSDPGSPEQPFRTPGKLVASLEPGQIGCLRSGLYVAPDRVVLANPETTLTSYPGERAEIRGTVWVPDEAPGSTVSGLILDGRNPEGSPSPIVNGDGVTIADNEITNHHTGICVSVGSADTYGRAQGTVIEGNEIHDCGRLPSRNFDHGIYVNSADDTLIRDNWIHDNADRGVQMYPDAQRTLVTGNTIVDNGEGVIFGGSDDTASSDNVVEHNLIAGSKIRNDVESSWGGPVGTGNVARYNCIGPAGIDDSNGGFTFTGNEQLTGTDLSCALLTP